MYGYLIGWVVELLVKLKDDFNLVMLYLGSGVLLVVVKNGWVFDILMGFMLLMGVIMGMCVGDVDLVVLLFFMKVLKIDDLNEIMMMFNN